MRIMINRKYDDCPACKKPMFIGLEVELPEGGLAVEGDQLVGKDAKIIGCVTEHDCRPKVTRGTVTATRGPGLESTVLGRRCAYEDERLGRCLGPAGHDVAPAGRRDLATRHLFEDGSSL